MTIAPAPRRPPSPESEHDTPRGLRALAWTAAGWSTLYALYRGYYAFGGTLALPGRLRGDAHATFAAINAFAMVALLLGAGAALLAPRIRSTRFRIAYVVGCWAVAVGCVMHALVDMTVRVLSIGGALAVAYPSALWSSVDVRAADLQDLFGNEPWFLVEGVLFGAIGVLCVRSRRGRRGFLLSAVLASAVAVTIGLLTASGHLPRLIVG